MQTYLVGGAVRDELLNYPVIERDWVVVGATPKHLLDQGFRQVGKDFPVFLHPDTREEYALARTERKQGHGYTGFDVAYAPNVTLEEDLLRRDLTINAMARDDAGRLIDPYGGKADLDARLLRHVSDAFIEDPLRVLRVARFAARYAHLGFTVAEETLALMATIVAQGELQYLPAERLWVETEKALGERNPEAFVRCLRDCRALYVCMPEVDALFGVPQRPEHHPEVDTGEHVLLVLQQAARLGGSSRVAFAALTHDLGKGITPGDMLPSHHGHEVAGLPLLAQLCDRLKVPNNFRNLAMAVGKHHLNCHRVRELRATTVLKLLEEVGGLRDPQRLEEFIQACEADARGRPGYEDRDYPQADYLRSAGRTAASVGALDVHNNTDGGKAVTGKAMGDAIRTLRLARLNALRKESG